MDHTTTPAMIAAIAGAGFRVQRVEVFNPEAFTTPVFKIEW